MKNLKIWVKMAAGLGAIIVLIIILSVLSSSLLGKVETQTQALKNEYLPLQDRVVPLNSTVLRIPALMNEYLLTGKNESYEKLEDIFKLVRQHFTDLEALEAKYPELKTGRGAKALESYNLLEKTIRASHDVNEQFMALRAEMIKTGAEVAAEVKDFVLAQDKVQADALRAEDLAELTRVVPLTGAGNAILDEINLIRANMLRSMAEQNRSFSRDNVPVLFPELLKRVDALSPLLLKPSIQEMMSNLRAKIVHFRDLQDKMQKLWDQQEKLTAARAPAREATLSLMQDRKSVV